MSQVTHKSYKPVKGLGLSAQGTWGKEVIVLSIASLIDKNGQISLLQFSVEIQIFHENCLSRGAIKFDYLNLCSVQDYAFLCS